VKKERSWLEEEREEIKRIERKIEEVLGLMREAEEEEDRREMLVRKVEDEAQVNSELREELAEQ
jgi:t-SNARE complex subunit (syntaxin)